MAKVKEAGVLSPYWERSLVCEGNGRRTKSGCGAVISVTKSDLFTMKVSDIGGSRVEVRFVCPECGMLVLVKGRFVTDELPTYEDFKANNCLTPMYHWPKKNHSVRPAGM